jgi:nicotinate phosphoribosyltransferase
MTSALNTDGYKFSMAEAGWPLRQETFYYSHRKGGVQFLPFDVGTMLKKMIPELSEIDSAFLRSQHYEVGSAYSAALKHAFTIDSVPSHQWFLPREPIFSITGASALVSWLEPLVLMFNFRIQLATAAKLNRVPSLVATCQREKEIILATLDSVGFKAPSIQVDSDGYVERVKKQGKALIEIVENPDRIFEVGLRAATCIEQHLLALTALQEIGINRTSHVYGAQKLNLTAVGTMGHEHVQRYGSDEAAFRAMTDRRHQRSSFLLDTFDTVTSGIPAAFSVMKERPGQMDSIRYDSGDKEFQYRFAEGEAKKMDLEPVHILEDGFDIPQTTRFELLRKEMGVPASRQIYGYGGFLIAKTSGNPFTRDTVAAVYKLSKTGSRSTMKFGNELGQGKQSVPGLPVVFRRTSGSGPFGIIGQKGEMPPDGYVHVNEINIADIPMLSESECSVGYSIHTKQLMQSLLPEPT